MNTTEAAEMQLSDVRENWSIIVWVITAIAGAIAGLYKWAASSKAKAEARQAQNERDIARNHAEIIQVKSDLQTLTQAHNTHVIAVNTMEATMNQMALGVARIEGAVGIIMEQHRHERDDVPHGDIHGGAK